MGLGRRLWEHSVCRRGREELEQELLLVGHKLELPSGRAVPRAGDLG